MQNESLCFSFNFKHQLGVEPFERLPPTFDTKKIFLTLVGKDFIFNCIERNK
jgi:hypothetical protein